MTHKPRRNRRPVPGSVAFDRRRGRIYLATPRLMREARQDPGALVAPADADWELFQWPVQDLHLVVIGEAEMRQSVARLAGVLLRDGARLVVGCANPGGSLGIYQSANYTRT